MFEKTINSPRLIRTVDPAMYRILCECLKYKNKFRTIFSCQGHIYGDPAWIKVEFIDKKFYEVLKHHISSIKYFKIDPDTIYVFHRNKYPDLYQKLEELESILKKVEAS